MSKMDQVRIDARVANFQAVCRKHRIKATHQRVEIMRDVASTDEHPDAESVYRRVRRRIPALSLDTVYRTLRLLEDHGVISRVGSMKDRARFDANTDRHHHFVCTRCGLVRDFYSPAFDRFAPPAEVRKMGSVEAVYVELRGLCRTCRERVR